jgi:hypothetical protein
LLLDNIEKEVLKEAVEISTIQLWISEIEKLLREHSAYFPLYSDRFAELKNRYTRAFSQEIEYLAKHPEHMENAEKIYSVKLANGVRAMVKKSKRSG